MALGVFKRFELLSKEYTKGEISSLGKHYTHRLSQHCLWLDVRFPDKNNTFYLKTQYLKVII
ncbi:MAG: hypothetical protein EAZ89_18145 [Bacteroidetes bacterium]|jgi:hypothetical protein|nr:MAG: hypothetical protein EAZ89_18145 [Bacteroidota bacterium]